MNISIAANIGTAVAASLAFLALHEMKRQRAQADKPKLLVSAVQRFLEIYWTEIKEPFPAILPLKCISAKAGPRPRRIDTKEDTADLHNQLDKLVKDTELELINAGLGPAIEVNIDWAIEKSIAQLTEELKESNLGGLEVDYQEGRYPQLWIKGKKGGPLSIFIVGQEALGTEFSYLLPYSNTERDKGIIMIPHVLLLILLLILATKTLIPPAKTVDFDKEYTLPSLSCNISFKDRGGRKHRNSFMLEFKMSSITALGRIPPEPGTVCASLKLCLSLKQEELKWLGMSLGNGSKSAHIFRIASVLGRILSRPRNKRKNN